MRYDDSETTFAGAEDATISFQMGKPRPVSSPFAPMADRELASLQAG